MEGNSSEIGDNSKNVNVKVVEEEAIKEEEEEEEEEEEDEDEEGKEVLKRRILGHPLCGLLIETHINCLQVGLGETGEVDGINATRQANFKVETSSPGSSDLDLFMEAYCITLSKLKEAIEEPLQETASFIKGMYEQLRELSKPEKCCPANINSKANNSSSSI